MSRDRDEKASMLDLLRTRTDLHLGDANALEAPILVVSTDNVNLLRQNETFLKCYER